MTNMREPTLPPPISTLTTLSTTPSASPGEATVYGCYKKQSV